VSYARCCTVMQFATDVTANNNINSTIWTPAIALRTRGSWVQILPGAPLNQRVAAMRPVKPRRRLCGVPGFVGANGGEHSRDRLEFLEVEVTGDADVRGTLAMDAQVPVGFQAMRCVVRLRAAKGTNQHLLEKLCAASQRSCVVGQTLLHSPSVETTFDMAADEARGPQVVPEPGAESAACVRSIRVMPE
jgi:hypothetical protein